MNTIEMTNVSSSLFLQAVRLVIRPIVALCLRRGVKIQELSEVTKEVLCQEAIRSLLSVSEKPTTSKIAALTGMHRRDVMRLTDEESEKKAPVPLFRKVIGQWQYHRQFATSPGKAKPLSFEGKDSEFAALVASVSQDLNPYTVLFELERIGAVKKIAGGKIKLVAEVYLPKGNIKQGFELLASDIDDLVKAVEENVMLSLDPPHHHVKTHYDNIALEALPQIRAWFLEQGGAFHEKARSFLSKFDRDLNPKLENKPGGARVAFGSFSLTQSSQEEEK